MDRYIPGGYIPGNVFTRPDQTVVCAMTPFDIGLSGDQPSVNSRRGGCRGALERLWALGGYLPRMSISKYVFPLSINPGMLTYLGIYPHRTTHTHNSPHYRTSPVPLSIMTGAVQNPFCFILALIPPPPLRSGGSFFFLPLCEAWRRGGAQVGLPTCGVYPEMFRPEQTDHRWRHDCYQLRVVHQRTDRV